MEFFGAPLAVPDEPDDDEPEHRMPEWMGPPDDSFGFVLPVNKVLVRTDHVSVGLTHLIAYPRGLSLDLRIAVRRGDWPSRTLDDVQESLWAERRHRNDVPSPDGLRFGVQLADGLKVEAGGLHQFASDVWRTPPKAPVLRDVDGSGGGGSRVVHQHKSLWLWPYPAGDGLDVFVAWTALQVRETSVRVPLATVGVEGNGAFAYWQD